MAAGKETRPDPTTAEMRKGAHGVYETVTVEGPGGPMRINAHEYDEEEHGKQLEQPKGRSGGSRKAKKAELEDMTKEEIMKELDKQGVEYPSHATKDELVKLAQKGA